MTNYSINTSENNKLIESINTSMTLDAKIILKNVKSKVDKAISCSNLLLEIYRENLRKINNTKNNDIIAELVNKNKKINEIDFIVRDYILEDMQIISDNIENLSERIEKLEKTIKGLHSMLNKENKNEIVEELNIRVTESNNIELAFKIEVEKLNEYKRYAKYLNNRE